MAFPPVLFSRDLVHRQTGMTAIQHMALGVFGFGCEDALTHLLNHVWPNIFETSPHVVQAFMGSIEGIRVGTGPHKILQYTLQVKISTAFHTNLFSSLLVAYPSVSGYLVKVWNLLTQPPSFK